MVDLVFSPISKTALLIISDRFVTVSGTFNTHAAALTAARLQFPEFFAVSQDHLGSPLSTPQTFGAADLNERPNEVREPNCALKVRHSDSAALPIVNLHLWTSPTFPGC